MSWGLPGMGAGKGSAAGTFKGISPRQIVLILCSLIPPALILALCPFGLTLTQAAVAALLVLTVIWWVSKLVDRTIASIVLLLGFFLFGGVGPRTVFSFPLSETFVLIILSFLFSEGVKNSGLLDKLLLPVLSRFARSPGRALGSMLVINLVMIFIIPQPFSRIILCAVIYDRFFRAAGMDDDLRSALLLSLHMCAITVNMAFLRGDLILNNALLSISGAGYSELTWMKYMAVPSLVYSVLFLVLLRIVFRRPMAAYPAVTPEKAAPWTKAERRSLIVLLIIILLWAAEDLHGVSGTIIVAAGTLLMVPLGLLRPADLKCIDVKLLVFLTAAFSIGGVMKGSGTAQVIFSQFAPLFPDHFSLLYLFIILVVSMAMHMLLGSSITTMSVVVPSLLIIADGVAPTPVLLFSIYIMASAHCVLPFHNVITMIGEGRGCFRSRDMLRCGLSATAPILLAVLFLFYGWWRLMGA